MKTNKHDEIAERIANLPLDPEYKQNNNLPIPLGKGVLVKKLEQSSIIEVGGILLMEGDNSRKPNLGIIQAVGPLCSDHVRVGLRCFYNIYVDSYFTIDGNNYAKMDEVDVYYIVPPKAIVIENTKDEKQVRREKGQKEQDARTIRVHNHDQNEKDQYKESKKKAKIFAVTKK
tara:strand:+ start:71 stop:589 length:519 start_codon:yes stop_codon:yes gene_type:complete